MSDLLLDLSQIQPFHSPKTGGKAAALATLMRNGFSVPDGICLFTDVYRRFIETTAL